MFRGIHLLLRSEHRQVEDEDVWTKTELEEIEKPQDEQRTKEENVLAINPRAHKLPCLFTKQIFVGCCPRLVLLLNLTQPRVI